MLGHQLPQLPALDSLVSRVQTLLEWVDIPAALPASRLAAAPSQLGESLVAPPGIQYSGSGGVFEQVRFAGANRLMIEFDYDGKPRRAEPYSFRRATTGNVLLYEWEDGTTRIKSFNMAKISSVRVTQATFSPRYKVEFTRGGTEGGAT